MVSFTMTIVYDGKGVRLSGPLQDKVLCYGMLEAARVAVQEYKGQEATKGNVLAFPANAMPPNANGKAREGGGS